jgi:hypothetical protein
MSRMPNLASRLFLSLVVLASLGHVGVLFPRFLAISAMVPEPARPLVWAALVTILTAVGACVLALILVVRSWRSEGARSLVLFLAFLAAFWGSLLRFLHVDVLEDSVTANLSAEGWGATMAVAGLLLATGAFVRFSTLFPVPLSPHHLPPPRRMPWLRATRTSLFRPQMVWGAVLLLLVADWGLGELFSGLMPTAEAGESIRVQGAVIPFLVAQIAVVAVSPLLGIGLGIRNLASGYHLASRADRRRVLWLVAGISAAGWMVLGSVLGLPLVVILRLPDWLVDVLLALLVLAPTVLVVTSAVAIFYAGSVDPGLVLRRSTVYGALGALGILLFAGLEDVLSNWMASRIGLPGIVGSLLAGSLAAGVMIPLRKSVDRIASRVLPGQGREAKEQEGQGLEKGKSESLS